MNPGVPFQQTLQDAWPFADQPAAGTSMAWTSSANYVKDGWNITGDTYRVDDDGYFWYEGRTDDMIVSAGYKIAAVEIEAALMEHPKVMECAVIGAPSEERGEIVKAFVVFT